MRVSRLRQPMQVLTFLRKEALDVLRQPRLLITLVFGPFLVMAIFGIGYRDTPKPMRTLFVAPPDSPFTKNVNQYAKEIGTFVRFEGVTSDEQGAYKKLADGKVDLVVSFPDKPMETILGGEQATIRVVHTRLDPIEQTAISFASRISVDEINGQILAGIVSGGQRATSQFGDVIKQAQAAADTLDASADSGDAAAKQTALADLDSFSRQLSGSVETMASLTAQLSSDPAAADVTDTAQQLRSIIASTSESSSAADLHTTAATIRSLVDQLSTGYQKFASVDPTVLAQPFRSKVELAVDNVNNVSDWYAPAAVILMLQQFGVAFGALSFVRERQLGIVDVFRVAPVNATQALVGKYLAYMLIGGVIGAALTALVVSTLHVPIQASISQIAIAMGLTLFASIGLGLVISLASASDAQAVQYTLIVLLASLFFSGFFLSLNQLQGAATLVSWLLPVSYGMQLLRDVMLRGAPLNRDLMLGLGGYGVVMFIAALLGTRRRMSVAS
jgi:ABC-2 type transport system permease protein